MTKGLRDLKPSPSVASSLGLCVASSVLYILAFPNFNLSWLAWVALVPLSLSLRLFVAPSPRQAFLCGWLSGTLAYAGILYWIIVTFQAAHLSMGLACLCLMLLAGYLGLFWGAWAWFLASSKQESKESKEIRDQKDVFLRSDLLAFLALPALKPFAGAAAWVALEYLRTYLFSGFPWVLLADSQVRILPMIQIASITGVYGVSFLVVFVNLVIAFYCHPRENGPSTRPAGPSACLLEDGDPSSRSSWSPAFAGMTMMIMSCLFGLFRLHHPFERAPARPIRVALLQGSIDQYKKWDKSYVEEIEKSYEKLVAKAVQSKPDIIIWPETSVPGYLMQDVVLNSWLQPLIRHSHVHHLVGAPMMDSQMAYNAAFSIYPEGDLDGIYAKQHLVPFGEIVPWAEFLGKFIHVLNDLGGFTPGRLSPVLDVAGHPVGVNICYEAIFPNLVRQSVKQGAVAIANLTNDGWYMRTSEPYQHWAPNVFRAVENARWVLRADNTGISGIIDPNGRVQAASRIFEPGVITGWIEPQSNQTPYTRWGDFFAWSCCLVTIVSLVM